MSFMFTYSYVKDMVRYSPALKKMKVASTFITSHVRSWIVLGYVSKGHGLHVNEMDKTWTLQQNLEDLKAAALL